MDEDTIKKIASFYDTRYDEFGNTIKSVGWGNKETQELRFKVLSEIGDLEGTSVCDLGSGFGDMYHYLTGHFKGVQYTGIDISERLLSQARLSCPQGNFVYRDILSKPLNREYDYILCSGALNLKIEDHEQFVEQMLTIMFQGCRRGVAINFLSTYVDFQVERNFHFSPEKALTLGKKLTRYVALRHEYPLYEFTLYLYREPQSCNAS